MGRCCFVEEKKFGRSWYTIEEGRIHFQNDDNGNDDDDDHDDSNNGQIDCSRNISDNMCVIDIQKRKYNICI